MIFGKLKEVDLVLLGIELFLFCSAIFPKNFLTVPYFLSLPSMYGNLQIYLGKNESNLFFNLFLKISINNKIRVKKFGVMVFLSTFFDFIGSICNQKKICNRYLCQRDMLYLIFLPNKKSTILFSCF